MVGRLMGKRLSVEVPVLVTTDLPFKYPPGLYIEQIQGDVTLRLFIDSLGAVVRESTKVAEPAKYDLFDSAAVDGAAKLTFRPARRGEHRIPYAVLFPVKFRVPNGPPLPQDTGSAPVKP
jgi:TonB family protein